MTHWIVVTFWNPATPPIIKGFQSRDAAKAYQHGVVAILEERGMYVFRYEYKECVEMVAIHG